MEFYSLRADAIDRFQGAADNAMLTVPATNAMRAPFVSAT
jgi:hypothetical protein